MKTKRLVTDILSVGGAPVAFEQISHKSKKYKGVCPWCAKDLDNVKANTFGDLYFKLIPTQAKHMDSCTNRTATEMEIKIKNNYTSN
jgi:hypothetical protein